MVRVYVKVQCGGLVLRLDKKKVSLLFFPNLTEVWNARYSSDW